MLALRVALGFAIVGQVALAAWLWPELPERIPIGRPIANARAHVVEARGFAGAARCWCW